MVLALRLFDRQIVDAGIAVMHGAGLVELPIFVSIRAEPVAGVVVPFIREAHRDAGAIERPELFDEAIVELTLPLTRQELLDLFPAVTNSARLRQRLSTVYARQTLSGSREFNHLPLPALLVSLSRG